MSHLKAGLAFGAILAVSVAGAQGVPAFASSSTVPSPQPSVAPSIRTLSQIGSIARAQSAAAVTARALGLVGGQRLVVKDVISDADGATHVRYDRTFDGLRVIGGDFVSHRDSSGTIRSVSWNGSRQATVPSTKPRISLAEAGAAGTGKALLLHETGVATRGELVVYSGGASRKEAPKLAYDVLTRGVRRDQTPSRLHTVIDADTGATLATWDEIENVGTGHGIYVGTVPIGTTAGPPWSMRDAAGNYTTDANGQVDGSDSNAPKLAGATFTDADNIWGNGTNTDRASAAVDAQYGAEETFAFYKNVLGRAGIWNTGVGARSRVHYGNGYVNAFWDGTQMTYGDGALNARPLVEIDVTGHEMTHGVTEKTAGLGYTGDAGGLNEGTSDIFGTAVEWYANNPADPPNYLIGERVNVNGNGTPLRYLDRPSRDGKSKDCWSPTLGSLDPHISSGPLNHWFYLASEGSGAKSINGVAYNSPTCNASTVTPIGRDKAEKIWYRTLTTYLTSNSDYAAARDGAIQSARDLYGGASPECAGIAASFSAIAVPAGAQSCTSAPAPPVSGNLLHNPGFESGPASWTATAGVIGQNGPDEPARSGTRNAWLGGYGAAHTDSISQLVAIPAGRHATLRYYVHIDTAETSKTSRLDSMTLRAGSTLMQTLSNLDAAKGYQLRTVDLSAYAGKTTLLTLTGVENSLNQTSFAIDDTAVTTSTLPAAPIRPVATAGNARALVSWTAPVSNGGSAITGYKVIATPGWRMETTSWATKVTVTGLVNGTGYTFRVFARNALGWSPYALSNVVKPAATR